jgi:hypothetical protein
VAVLPVVVVGAKRWMWSGAYEPLEEGNKEGFAVHSSFFYLKMVVLGFLRG